MNISKPLILCFLATAWVFAQAPVVQVQAPSVQVQAPAPTSVQVQPSPAAQVQAPVQTPAPQVQVQYPAVQTQAPVQAPAPAAVEYFAVPPQVFSPPPPAAPAPSPVAEIKPVEKSIFDSVRGDAYNPFGTVGAASTVGDLVSTPSDIFGNKFLYVSPLAKVGYAAFDFVGGSALLGLDKSETEEGDNLAALVLGYANSGFGLALKYSVRKIFASNEKTNISTKTTYPADNIELYLSFPVGSGSFYVNGGLLTEKESGSADINGKTRKIDYSTITANVGLQGSSYNIHLNFARQGGTYINSKDKKAVDEDTYSAFALGLDLGSQVLQSQNARVIIGLNDTVAIAFRDKIDTLYKGDNIIYAQLTPNILGEVAITENLFAFVGAAHNLMLVFGDGDAEADTHRTIITDDDATLAYFGIRYQKPNWAIESQLSTNPFGALAGQNILFNLGGFIYF